MGAGLLGTCGQASPRPWRPTVARQQGGALELGLLQRRKQVPERMGGLSLGHTARQPLSQGPWRRGHWETCALVRASLRGGTGEDAVGYT